MNDDPIDRAFLHDDFEPSSGFTLRVMDAVRATADAPPPLRFPWGRLALGAAACLALAAAATQLAPLAGPALTAAIPVGQAAGGVGLGLALSRLPRLFVRS